MNRGAIKHAVRTRIPASQWDRLFEWVCTVEALFGRHERRVRFAYRTIRRLEQKLWGGFHKTALEDLEQCRRDAASAPWLVSLAALAQARWYAASGDWEKVVALLDRIPPPQIDRDTALRHRILRIEALLQTGRIDMAADCLQQALACWPADINLELMEMNLLARQAQVNGSEQGINDDSTRLECLNHIYRAAGLEPIALKDPAAPFELGNLTAAGGTRQLRVSEGPLVSVLMPAFNAQATLGYAVGGLLDQTYKNLEILIVDDGSSDRTRGIAEDFARRDDRVRVLGHDRNRGLYAARNTALAHAEGEFITVHDSDDWAHPQMLALQVAGLRDNARAVATFSRLCRVRNNLMFRLRPDRPMLEPLHWNFTSMLIGRERLEAMGGWDPVMAHADAELIQRLREDAGRESLIEVRSEVPLAFFNQSAGCITEQASTGIYSLHVGARREYEAQACHWRQGRAYGTRWPAIQPRTDGRTPFYVPHTLRPAGWKQDTDYDVILVSSLGSSGGTRRCNLAYIAACSALGLRVGLVNYPRYTDQNCGDIHPDYRDLLQAGNVDLLTAQDTARCRLLLLHHPPLLRRPFSALPAIRAERLLLLVNQLPWYMHSMQYEQTFYSVADVDRRFSELFGDDPAWVPISPLCRRLLAPMVDPARLHPEDWVPVLHPDFRKRWAPRTAEITRKPVLGRHSRDHWTKWPAAAETTLQAYGAALSGRVRLLGGCAHSPLMPRRLPGHWEVMPFDSMAADDFLDTIDVFVHFPHEDYIEEFGRNVMEAMAAGVPCILPEAFRENFGDAARYCAPDEVVAVINELWANAEMYEAMSQRGLAFVDKHCTPACAERRLRGALMEQLDATQ
ncbi:MAG: glycosyltransferase [Gammaproteobacteria bacterium]|nr:glycosyltransferase [Gammaproteobacteria bacterium]